MADKYEEMTDQELEDLSAQIVKWPVTKEYWISDDGGKSLCHCFDGERQADEYLSDMQSKNYLKNYYVVPIEFYRFWNPTNLDSNQVERCLFPKVESFGSRIVERRVCVGILPYYEVTIYRWQNELRGQIISQLSCEYYELKDPKINRTKLIACLVFLEEIKKSAEKPKLVAKKEKNSD